VTRQQKQEHAAIVEEMRRLARSGVETSPELVRWQELTAANRAAREQAIFEALGEKIDLRSIMESRQDRERSRQIDEALAELEAEASRLANQEKARLLRVHGQYRD
jgi:hypothetical protein